MAASLGTGMEGNVRAADKGRYPGSTRGGGGAFTMGVNPEQTEDVMHYVLVQNGINVNGALIAKELVTSKGNGWVAVASMDTNEARMHIIKAVDELGMKTMHSSGTMTVSQDRFAMSMQPKPRKGRTMSGVRKQFTPSKSPVAAEAERTKQQKAQ
mmetsp:Transcript_44322/g.90466  ORF Transcript_44322/g.90466 Transcript_44322/m.90466 type:complete len:155 (-) Transcript_44322:305-769(-)